MGNSTVDFWLYGSNDNDDSSISDEWFDLDSETQKFIEKLNLRKEKISDLVKKDEDEISLLEEQIKKLRDNVSDIKSKIKLLNDEDKKIDSRISLINWASKPTKA
jgi:chromosome segregation ATPase